MEAAGNTAAAAPPPPAAFTAAPVPTQTAAPAAAASNPNGHVPVPQDDAEKLAEQIVHLTTVLTQQQDYIQKIVSDHRAALKAVEDRTEKRLEERCRNSPRVQE